MLGPRISLNLVSMPTLPLGAKHDVLMKPYKLLQPGYLSDHSQYYADSNPKSRSRRLTSRSVDVLTKVEVSAC